MFQCVLIFLCFFRSTSFPSVQQAFEIQNEIKLWAASGARIVMIGICKCRLGIQLGNLENKACVRDARRAEGTQRVTTSSHLMSLSGVPEEEKQSGWRCEVDQTWLPPAPFFDYSKKERGHSHKFATVIQYIQKKKKTVILISTLDGDADARGTEICELNPTWRASERNWRKRTWEELGLALLTPYIPRRHHIPPTAASVALGGVCP